MPPCAVCGDTGIDAAGYCVRCRTFRGLPGPAWGPPTSGVPASGVPMSGAPASGGGYAPPPASGAPYPGYGYPGAGFPPPASKSRRSVLPLIALSVTLVVVALSIVVVKIVQSRDESGPVGTTSQGASSKVDQCVVGTWVETSSTSDIAIDGVGQVPFTGKGNVQKFRADGTGVLDHGSGVTMTGKVKDQTWEYILNGSVSFRYDTSNGNLVYSDVVSGSTVTLKVNGVTATSYPQTETSLDPEHYTCSGDAMTEHTSRYKIELTRTSRSA